LALALALACSPARPRTPLSPEVVGWQTDLDSLVHDIETIHPNPFTKVPKEVFLEHARALSADLPALSEEQRVVRAMQLVASLGDGHTQLAPHRPDFGDWYPIRVHEFTDGYFVTSAFKSDADLAGAQLLTVAGRPVAEAMVLARSAMGADNAFGVRENLFAFHNAAIMKGLGLAGDDRSLRVRVKLSDGQVVERSLQPRRADEKRFEPGDSRMDWRFVSEVYGPPLAGLADWTTAFHGLSALSFRSIDTSRPPHLTYRRPYVARALPEQRAYYVQINNVQDMQDETLLAFFHRAMTEVDTLHPDRLIIDLRNNPGGDGSMTVPMIHELVKREDARPWKHLFVLTGRKTFSAALMFLQAFVVHTEVSIVGEPAGAGPDSYGDATTIQLPHARLELDVSTLFHKLDDDGERPDLTPVAVPALFSFADYVAGRDPALDPILRGDEMRSLPIIAVETGPQAARTVYEDRLRRFAHTPEWLPPRRIEMLRAIWKLQHLRRMQEAADLGAFVTDLYPTSARAWSVRGDAEIAAGLKPDGLKSYAQALRIDPNNTDAESERKALSDTLP
jgi:hypothetical protein